MQDRGLCSVHSFAWEDLGQLKVEALQIIAHSVCAQLGLCQELVREYADARLMIAQVSAHSLGRVSCSAVEVSVIGTVWATLLLHAQYNMCMCNVRTSKSLHRQVEHFARHFSANS